MSTKRILGITVFGVLLIVAIIGVMLLVSYVMQENEAISLPETTPNAEIPGDTAQDMLDRVDITRETVQAVVSTLERPAVYSREIVVESFWDGGHATYNISAVVYNDLTSIRTEPPAGKEKRIVVTPDALYIWYEDDDIMYIGENGSSGDGYRTADEYQMLDTYEDILDLNLTEIIDAGYTEYQGDDCIYIECLSRNFGYIRNYYISIELGLVKGVEEYDETGMLVYRMTAGEYTVGAIDPMAFSLPDGTHLLAVGR